MGNVRLQARADVVVQVSWTRRATADLVAIGAYIAQFSPASARKMAQRLKEAAASLSTQPHRGRLIDAGVRELAVVRPYIIRYRSNAGTVRILRIRHSARKPLDNPVGFSEPEWEVFSVSPFEEIDEETEERLIAEAEADIAAGRVISNEAVVRWIKSRGTPDELPPPRCGE